MPIACLHNWLVDSVCLCVCVCVFIFSDNLDSSPSEWSFQCANPSDVYKWKVKLQRTIEDYSESGSKVLTSIRGRSQSAFD
jgi:hypothetical protein